MTLPIQSIVKYDDVPTFNRPTKEEAKATVSKLARKFLKNFDEYKETNYKEARVRADFIDEFLKALGWDLKNELELSEKRREVVLEDSIEVEDEKKLSGKSRAESDYTFQIDGVKQFFIEAKRPSIPIHKDRDASFQLRSYSYSAQLPIGFVTDFEELAVFDCTIKPHIDHTVERPYLIDYFGYSQYETKFDQIWDYLSYESVNNKKLLELAKTKTKQRGNSTLDTDFVESLNQWREVLARDIFTNNPQINTDDLNFAIQKILDRIIFLRVCEDRQIEPYDQLKGVLMSKGKGNIYSRLIQDFKRAAGKYNSDLFNFTRDTLTPTLIISDETIKTVINELYDSPYVFSYIPVEILGNAYERFLGKTITVNSRHKIVIEEKPEVRKAGGVFYTPQYIVNYIVENTVGRMVIGKTPEQVAMLRILDPSCGSGSFLIGVYQYLLDWHKSYYKRHIKEYEKSKNKVKPYRPDGSLTNAERKRILLNNIYGVDLDEQAIEVTKLSLMLKALEGETAETVSQLTNHLERVLPSLDDNIRCGNSLIANDITPSVAKTMLEEIKPFDWQITFKKVFDKGGFDVIIGNPPYGAMFNEHSKTYLRDKFTTFIGRGESYVVFIEKVISLLKGNGLLGFIIPDTYLNLEFTKPIRTLLLSTTKIKEIVVLPSTVFADATVDTTILITQKEKAITGFYKTDVSIRTFAKKAVLSNLGNPMKEFDISTQKWFDTNSFNVGGDNNELNLVQKIDTHFQKMESIAEMFSGVKSYEVGKGNPPQTAKIRDEKPFTSEKQIDTRCSSF